MKKNLALVAALAVLATPGLVQSAEPQGMDHKSAPADKAQARHNAVGVVKKVDRTAGTVMLAHDPVKSLNWPAMTMAFHVADKALLDKLSEGRKVEFEFEVRGKNHVITNAR